MNDPWTWIMEKGADCGREGWDGGRGEKGKILGQL